MEVDSIGESLLLLLVRQPEWVPPAMSHPSVSPVEVKTLPEL